LHRASALNPTHPTINQPHRSPFQVIKQQLADGVPMRRVGFVSAGAPARQHSEITTPEGEVVGEVTSGAFSPNLKKNVAMG
jgi:aminomethyltransferase